MRLPNKSTMVASLRLSVTSYASTHACEPLLMHDERDGHPNKTISDVVTVLSLVSYVNDSCTAWSPQPGFGDSSTFSPAPAGISPGTECRRP